VTANDEFFAPKDNLLKTESPVFIPDKYTDRGKWMDGWETRRRRTPGHDWCIVHLGLPGIVRAVVVDTSFFRGNYPPQCSIDAAGIMHYADDEAVASAQGAWWPLLPLSPLQGDTQNVFDLAAGARCTHLRLNIHPDGGVARLRVLGEAMPDLRPMFAAGGEFDLAALVNGATVVDTSDRFFGDPRNMLGPARAENMGDGWETRRRRGPGHDWAVVRLAVEGELDRVEVDTAFFKGNYPDRCSIEAAQVENPWAANALDGASWTPVLAPTALHADSPHAFERELTPGVVATHVRLNIFPDGGISRFRVFGTPTVKGREAATLRLINAMDDNCARTTLADCCAAPAWVDRMIRARPYRTKGDMDAASRAALDGLAPADWLEAFRHHPRIGEQRAERPLSTTAQDWSTREQATAATDDMTLRAELARLNRAYEAKFGHVFIVCANGLAMTAILESLRTRLDHTPADEQAIAARELRRITELRLGKMLS
jgi:allantoicase